MKPEAFNCNFYILNVRQISPTLHTALASQSSSIILKAQEDGKRKVAKFNLYIRFYMLLIVVHIYHEESWDPDLTIDSLV